MEKLYQKIKLNSFEIIREELLSTIAEHKKTIPDQDVVSWLPNIDEILSKCPELNKFLNLRSKKKIHQIKFYVSPPGIGTGHHVDGHPWAQPFGLTIPLQFTENTFFNWYEDDYENFKIKDLTSGPTNLNFETAAKKVVIPKDISALKLLESIEITTPTFTKSDIMHSVTNNSNGIRIVVLIRWSMGYENIEDVFDTTGILEE